MRDESGKAIDVLSIDVWERNLKNKVTIVQHFHPNNGKGQFYLSKDILIFIDGQKVENEHMTNIVKEGIGHHPIANQYNNWVR